MCPFRVYKHKKLAAISVAAVLCMASFGVFAATEHWNDASLTPKVTTKTSVSDNTDWQQGKDNWDQTKTQYEQVSIAPGADASQMNFGWYSKTKAKVAEVRIADNKDMKHAKTFKDNYESQNLCYTIADMKQGVLHNSKGVFYMSSNSATGSKFYNLIPQQQDYIAACSQTWRPTYSVIHITKDTFSVETYDVETGTPIDSTYSIVKD